MITAILKVLTFVIGMFITGVLLLLGSTLTFLPAVIAFILTVLFTITA